MFGKPNKWNVLDRFAERLGPQQNAVCLLSHLGDQAVFKPFAPGEEPTMIEVLSVLLVHNEHITLDDIMVELQSKNYQEFARRVR